MTRQQIIELIDQVIFKNNSKLITAEKDNDLRKKTLESVYVKDSDTLSQLEYSSGETLQEKLDEIEGQVSSPVILSSYSNTFSARNVSAGTSLGSRGGVSYQCTAKNDVEATISCTFTGGSVGAQYVPLLSWWVMGTPWHRHNAVVLSHGQPQQSSIAVYTQNLFNGDPGEGRIRLTLLRIN